MSQGNPHFISQDELNKLLQSGSVKPVDGSWYLPSQNRDAKADFKASRIAGAVYFDIDEIADTDSNLPHMLPTPDAFSKAVGELGLSASDAIVVYDGPGVFSAARVWWSLSVMGAKSVRILEGGFDGWKAAGLPVETGPATVPKRAKFSANLATEKILNYEQMTANLKNGDATVLDARPFARFTGQQAEPRPGLRRGHIPGSHSLPAAELVRDGRLLPIAQLQAVFQDLKLDPNSPVITSCGSGVTAAIISLALASSGYNNHALYDGSWAEWGARDDAPIARWQD